MSRVYFLDNDHEPIASRKAPDAVKAVLTNQQLNDALGLLDAFDEARDELRKAIAERDLELFQCVSRRIYSLGWVFGNKAGMVE